MDLEITDETIETVKDVKEDIKDSLEETIAPDCTWKICYMDEHFFNHEDDAIKHIFEKDEYYQQIKHLNDEDKVVRRYGGKYEELLPFIPYIENN